MSGKYLEKFDQIFNFTRNIVRECGLDVISEDYKRNWRTLCTFLAINVAVIFTFYIMYVDAVYNNNWGTVLISLALLGLGLQGYAKFLCVLGKSNQHGLRFMHKEISDIYIEFEHKSLAYRNNLNASISRVKKILTTLFSVVTVAITLVLGVPIYMLIVHNKRTLILAFIFPFIDIKTDFGYYLTLFIHVCCSVLGGLDLSKL
ncbi:hypothetical protein DOY81_013786 [Sarcophaga bullata]|nr:hypothetical protein DOY81_013786 [Sarcophaga bullata]